MALFIPIFVLLIFSIAIQILRRRGINLAQLWLISTIGVIVAWLSILFIFLLPDLVWKAPYLLTADHDKYSFIFFLDRSNWIFGFLLLSTLVSNLFTDAEQFDNERMLLKWSSRMLIIGSGFAVILSGSTMTFLITSAILDLIIFGADQIIRSENRNSLIDLCMRFAGTFLIILGEGLGSDLKPFLLLSGLSIRLGVFNSIFLEPFGFISRQKSTPFIDMVLSLSTIFFIGQINGVDGKFWGKVLLEIIVIVSVFLKCVGFIRNIKTGYGVRLWFEAFSGMVLLALLLGNTDLILPLGIVSCTWGAVLALDIIRTDKLKIAILVLMLAMIGLPYTPTAGLWITHEPGSATAMALIVNIFVLFLLLTGSKKIINMSETSLMQDGWVSFSMGVGPLFLLVMPWANILFGEKLGEFTFKYLWAGVFLLGSTLTLLADRNPKVRNLVLSFLRRISPFLQFLTIIVNFFSLKWMRPFFSFIKQIVYGLIHIFNRALEGDGGLLWAILFLILISSILVTYRLLI